LATAALTTRTTPALAEPAPAGPRGLAESTLLTRFCQSSPTRSAARALVAQGQAAVDDAAVLPNPTLILEHNRSFTASEDTETVIGLGIPLGIGGRRFLLSDAADERLAERKAHARAAMVARALALEEALVRATAARKRSELLGTQHAELVAIGVTIEGLEKGGEAAPLDRARHALAVDLHAERLTLAKSAAASARAQLRAYVDEEVDLSALDLSAIAAVPPPAPASSPGPTVQSLDATLRATDLEIDAAERRWIPDLELFLGYRHVTTEAGPATDAGHGIALRLGFPLTFFDHGQGEVSVLAARLAATRAERELVVQTKRGETAAADAALEALGPARPAAGSTAERATKLRAQAKTLYLAGQGSLTDVLVAADLDESSALSRIDLDEARAMARIAKMRAAESLFEANLDHACGVDAR
jgi:outer membrane protein TolC